MTLEELIGDGWKRHDGQAREVAAALADARELLVTPSQLPAYARLLTHLYAEHLDDPTIGVRLLLPLRDRFEGAATTSYRPIRTAMATLEFLASDPRALNGLSHEERASALATAASAIAARGDVGAGVAAITAALELAAAGVPDASPALRALAVGASNIAVELERKTDRGRDDDRAMVRIADAALAPDDKLHCAQQLGELETNA
jgi:hypothetical protein